MKLDLMRTVLLDALTFGWLRNRIKPSTKILDLSDDPTHTIQYLNGWPTHTPAVYAINPHMSHILPTQHSWLKVFKPKELLFDIVLLIGKKLNAKLIAQSLEHLAPNGIAFIEDINKLPKGFRVIDHFSIGAVDIEEAVKLGGSRYKRLAAWFDPDIAAAVVLLDDPEAKSIRRIHAVINGEEQEKLETRDGVARTSARDDTKTRVRVPKLAEKHVSSRSNSRGQTCGERIRELLDERGCIERMRDGGTPKTCVTNDDVAAIMEVIKEEFPWSKAARTDIMWNLKKCA